MDGYKSICNKQCIDINGLTVLIGPNSSGKTSVLEALDKIARLRHTLIKHKDVKLDKIFMLEEINLGKESTTITYFRADGIPLKLSWNRHGTAVIGYSPLVGRGIIRSTDSLELSIDDSVTAISKNFRDVIVKLGSDIRSFLHRAPIKVKAVFKELPDIESSDIFEQVYAQVLYNILSDDKLKKQFSKLLKPLGYDSIGVEKKGSLLYLKARDSILGKWVYLEQAADGLRYTLPFIVSLVTSRKPTILLIDDVEIGLHPRAIMEVARFIMDVVRSNRARVVVTTHSEVFLYAVVLGVVKGVLQENKVALYVAYRDETGCTHYSRFKPSIPLRVEDRALKALKKMGAIGIFEEASTLIADIIKYYSKVERNEG